MTPAGGATIPIVEEVALVVNIHFPCTRLGIACRGFDTPMGACYTSFVSMPTILPGRVRQPYFSEAGLVAGEMQLRWLDTGVAGSKTAHGGQNVG